MEIRYAIHPENFKRMTTEEIRNHLLVKNIFNANEIKLVYSHNDRIIAGGAMPSENELKLLGGKELGSEYFLQNRELGVINVGGQGVVVLDKKEYELNNKDGIYVPRGIKEVIFKSVYKEIPAKFYINSAPAHASYDIVKIDIKTANKKSLGEQITSNKRTINQFIHPAVCKSCQLLMGLTQLEKGNLWNTMPCHTHDRRMEVYFYFDMDKETKIFHMVGEPSETRHVVVSNEEAVITPSWSIHSGVGTASYTFIWGMVGENQIFEDMDNIAMNELK